MRVSEGAFRKAWKLALVEKFGTFFLLTVEIGEEKFRKIFVEPGEYFLRSSFTLSIFS